MELNFDRILFFVIHYFLRKKKQLFRVTGVVNQNFLYSSSVWKNMAIISCYCPSIELFHCFLYNHLFLPYKFSYVFISIDLWSFLRLLKFIIKVFLLHRIFFFVFMCGIQKRCWYFFCMLPDTFEAQKRNVKKCHIKKLK